MGARSHGPAMTILSGLARPSSLPQPLTDPRHWGCREPLGSWQYFPPKKWLLPPKPKLLHVLSQVLTIRIGFNRRAWLLPSNPPHKSFL